MVRARRLRLRERAGRADDGVCHEALSVEEANLAAVFVLRIDHAPFRLHSLLPQLASPRIMLRRFTAISILVSCVTATGWAQTSSTVTAPPALSTKPVAKKPATKTKIAV